MGGSGGARYRPLTFMETLGQYLKREREFRKINLDELSKATRISPGFLKCIEEDRLQDLPSGAFVKGFLRSYVQHVGLDLTDVLTRYQASDRTREPENPFQKFQGFEVRNHMVLVGTLLVVLIVLAAYLASR